jgi:hypothetical protein
MMSEGFPNRTPDQDPDLGKHSPERIIDDCPPRTVREDVARGLGRTALRAPRVERTARVARVAGRIAVEREVEPPRDDR